MSTGPVLRRTFFSFPFSSPTSSTSSSPSSAVQGKGKLRRDGANYVYQESRIMHYSPQQMFEIIADVDNYRNFLPFATGSVVHSARLMSSTDASSPSPSDTQRAGTSKGATSRPWLVGGKEGDRWIMDASLSVGALGFSESYLSRVEAVKWSSVTARAKDASVFKHLLNRWTLSSVSSTCRSSPSLSTSSYPAQSTSSAASNAPQCQVDFHLTYAFASPLHAAAVSAAWERVSAAMIDAFETRARHVYGDPRTP